MSETSDFPFDDYTPAPLYNPPTTGGLTRTERRRPQAPTSGMTRTERTGPLDVTRPEGIYAVVQRLLAQYGLESLVPQVQSWMEDGLSEDEITIKLEATPEYEQRFPAMTVRRKAGMTPISPAQYIEYENSARQMMRASGLPEGFYDSATDFTDLIAGDVSLVELQGRVEEGYRRVNAMDSSVKAVFAQYFGVNGEANLAAYYLDPDRALPILERQTEQAIIGGAGHRLGYSITDELSRKLYETGVTGEQAQTALNELHENKALFSETVEEGQDLEVGDEGLKGAFGLDANSAEAIARRKRERESRFTGSGGASAGEEGFTGAGAAKSR